MTELREGAPRSRDYTLRAKGGSTQVSIMPEALRSIDVDPESEHVKVPEWWFPKEGVVLIDLEGANSGDD